ncbi:MAG: hypothetical protein ABIZ80_18935, partial [Bryobacteraceae bacterium]
MDKASYAQNRFNASLGGALIIPKLIHSDKTFFYFSYSASRSRNPFNAVATVPTLLERSGDFSQSVTRGPVSIFDPITHAPLPGNRIPANLWNPAARGLLEYIPLPNQPGLVQNYQYVTSAPSNSDNIGLRLNRSLTKADRIDSNFNMQRRDQRSQQLYQFSDQVDGTGYSLGLGWSHNMTRRTISNLRWNFSRNRSETLPFFSFGRNVAAELGITGTAQDAINYGPPNLSFTNFGGLTDASPVLRRDQTSSISEGIQFGKGKHNLSMGAEYRWLQVNNRSDQNARGTFSFSGIATSAFDAAGQPLPASGYDFADFLYGLPQSSSVRFGSANTYFRGSVRNLYGQDDWRVRSNLSLNLGFRYEYFSPFREKYNRIANLDVAPGFTGVAVVTPGQTGPYSGTFPNALINPDKNN